MKIMDTGMTPEQECRATWDQIGSTADFKNGDHVRASYLPPLSACFVEVGDVEPMSMAGRVFTFRLECGAMLNARPGERVGRVMGSDGTTTWAMTKLEPLK